MKSLTLFLTKSVRPSLFKFGSEALRSNFKLLLKFIEASPNTAVELFSFSTTSIKSNIHHVLQCLKLGFFVYPSIAEELKSDHIVVKEALKCSRFHLENTIFPNDVFKTCDRKLAQLASSKVFNFLMHTSKEYSNDVEIVTNAVLVQSSQFEFASEQCRDNFDITLIAVKDNGLLLKHASQRRRSDPAIALASLHQNIESLEFVDLTLFNNVNVMKKVISTFPKYYAQAGETVKRDKEILTMVLKYNGCLIKYIPQDLQHDRELATIAVKSTPNCIFYVPAWLLNDKELVYEACAKMPTILVKLPPVYRNDKILFQHMLHNRNTCNVVQFAGESIRNDFEIMIKMCTQHKYNLALVGEELRKNKGFWMQAVTLHKDAITFVPPELANDDDIILASISEFGNSDALELKQKKQPFVNDYSKDDDDDDDDEEEVHSLVSDTDSDYYY